MQTVTTVGLDIARSVSQPQPDARHQHRRRPAHAGGRPRTRRSRRRRPRSAGSVAPEDPSQTPGGGLSGKNFSDPPIPASLDRPFLTPGCSSRLSHDQDPKVFRSGRDFSAWIGLVPKQNSSGGQKKLGNIIKAPPILRMDAECRQGRVHTFPYEAGHRPIFPCGHDILTDVSIHGRIGRQEFSRIGERPRIGPLSQ